MKSLFRKRVGQSRQELSSALSFSLIIHIIFLSAALLFAFRSSPLVVVPPAYQVTLVGPAGNVVAVPPATAPVPPAPAPKKIETEKAEVKKAAPKKALPPVAKKGTMPGLGKPKHAPPAEQPEQPEKQGGKGTQPAAAPAGPPATVAMTTQTQQAFGFPPYLAIIRDKIERNWNPPPASKGAKARVMFKIYRSGQVAGADLAQSSGNFYFDQAAMRAILSSSPFPPLPEGFYKEYFEFSVDLMENE